MEQSASIVKESIVNFDAIYRLINSIVDESVDEKLSQLKAKVDLMSIPTKQVMTLVEASEFMGKKISTIRALLRNKDLPYYKDGKRLYLKTDEVVNYLLKNRYPSKSEIASKARQHIHELNSKQNKAKSNRAVKAS